MDFHVIWYILVVILLIGYAVLDGFDLGAGMFHLQAKNDTDRRIVLNSIGPVWDGNEVWLITAGGAMFAAFPDVYATAFSGFYMPFMLLLFALIFRAVSIEFRSKESSKRWRDNWDRSFAYSSFIIAFLFGVAIGNVVVGFQIGADKEFQGTMLDLISPYSLLTGLFNMSMFAMHGALYLNIKTEGELQKQVQKWAKTAYFVFIFMFLFTTSYTLYLRPEMLANFSFGYIASSSEFHPLIAENHALISVIAWIIVLLNVLSVANISRTLYQDKALPAFLSSACTMAAIILLFGLGLFPNMLVSNLAPQYSLDIYNASSSDSTLQTMFFVAIWGMPFVAAYTSIIYWTYRGKTKLTEMSY